MNISAPLFDVSDVEDNEEMRAGVGRQMIWLHLRGTNTHHLLSLILLSLKMKSWPHVDAEDGVDAVEMMEENKKKWH